MSELTQLLNTKSMMRYLPPKGTADSERCCVRRLSSSPRPPAKITASTLLMTHSCLSARPCGPLTPSPLVALFYQRTVKLQRLLSDCRPAEVLLHAPPAVEAESRAQILIESHGIDGL